MTKKFLAFLSKRYDVLLVVVLIIYLIYLIFASRFSYSSISNLQWVIFFGELILSIWIYLLLDSEILKKLNKRTKIAIIISTYIIVTWLEFFPTVFNIFRSDYWLFATLFYDSHQNTSFEVLKNIALFELFGHPRFMPLANLTMFLVNLILGNNIFLYHVLNLILHVTVSFFVFFLVYKHTKNMRFSYIFGLLFIVMPSQFDIVIWEYHVFLLFSTILIFYAILLSYMYSERGIGLPQLSIAFILMFISMFYYETHIFVPAVTFFIILKKYHSNSCGSFKERILLHKNDFFLVFGVVALIYSIFFVSFIYIMALTREKNVLSFRDILSLENTLRSFGVVFCNLWESTFLKNIGVIPHIKVADIVYVLLPKPFCSFVNIVNMILGLFLLCLFKFNRKNRYLVILLIALTMSYLFFISAGRLLSSPNMSYITSQPRYQYFSNAVFLIVAGMLLYPRYKQSKFKIVVTTILISIFFWNALTVLDANNKIAKAMKPMDAHYYRIKDFLKSHPSAKVFLSFVPTNSDPCEEEPASKFFLGTDIALDILFKDKITKFLGKATYTYDGNSFRENKLYKKEMDLSCLKDFTIEWMYWYPPLTYHNGVPTEGSLKAMPKKNAIFVGNKNVYPKITINTNYIEVAMINEGTGDIDVYKIQNPYPSSKSRLPASRAHMWGHFVLEMNEEELNLFYNAELYYKVKLKAKYHTWNVDSIDLLGEYYRGIGESVFIVNVFKQFGVAKYKAANYSIGETIDVDTVAPPF